QTGDVAVLEHTDLDRPRLHLRQVPHLLRIPDLGHILLHGREQPTRPQHLVRPVQILRPRNPLPALDLVDEVLAVPHGRAELAGPHADRFPPQLQLPPHRGDHGHAPLVVRVHLPPRLVSLRPQLPNLAVHRHARPSVVPGHTSHALPVRTAPTSPDTTGQPQDSHRTQPRRHSPR